MIRVGKVVLLLEYQTGNWNLKQTGETFLICIRIWKHTQKLNTKIKSYSIISESSCERSLLDIKSTYLLYNDLFFCVCHQFNTHKISDVDRMQSLTDFSYIRNHSCIQMQMKPYTYSQRRHIGTTRSLINDAYIHIKEYLRSSFLN